MMEQGIFIDPIHLETIKEVLSEALPSRKRSQISEKDIIDEYNRFNNEGLLREIPGEKFSYKFFPLKAVEIVVCSFVSKLKAADDESKRKPSLENKSDPAITSCSQLSLSLQPKKPKVEPEKEKVQKYFSSDSVMVSLMNLYPDIDPLYLKSIVDKNYSYEEIQDYIERNLDKIPERSTIQAIQYQVLQVQLGREEELWQCPGCRSWQKINKSDDDIVCSELNSCGSYCRSCKVKTHQPFDCRPSSVRHYYPDKGDETDLFKPLNTPPSLVKPTFRVFIMTPRNETDYSNPLDILYTAAEGTFLKMLKIAGDSVFSVPTTSSSSPQPASSAPSSNVTMGSSLVGALSSDNSHVSVGPTSLIMSSSSTTISPSASSVSSDVLSSMSDSYSNIGAGVSTSQAPTQSLVGSSSTSSSTGAGSSDVSNGQPTTGRQIRRSIPTSQSSTGASAGNSLVSIPSLRFLPRHGHVRNIPMMDFNKKVFDRSFIKEIHYFENDSLTERFRRCKERFQASGLPFKERLVFHGTSADIDSIMEKGLLMSMCKRSAYGVGIYFSEFPNISKMYGKTLLLCRVLVGKPFYGHQKTIPQGFNSKIVRPDVDGKAQIIVINEENQILPAFQVKVEWDRS